MDTDCEIDLKWIPLNLTNEKSSLAQAMARCVRQEVITWANVDQDQCCHMPSLSHNMFNVWSAARSRQFSSAILNGVIWLTKWLLPSLCHDRLNFWSCARIRNLSLPTKARKQMFNFEVGSSWWRHQMETFSAWLALRDGNPLVTGGFPSQGSMTQSFDISFDLRWVVAQHHSPVNLWPKLAEPTTNCNKNQISTML